MTTLATCCAIGIMEWLKPRTRPEGVGLSEGLLPKNIGISKIPALAGLMNKVVSYLSRLLTALLCGMFPITHSFIFPKAVIPPSRYFNMTFSEQSGGTRICLLLVLSLLFLSPSLSHADTIILKDGTKLETKRTWEKGVELMFFMEDTVTSIKKTDVERIEKENSQRKAHPKVQENRGNRLSTSNDIQNNEEKPIKKSMAYHHQGAPHIKRVLVAGFGPSDGFRDLPWGSNVSDIKGMVKIETDPGLAGVEEYIHHDDVLKIGEAELTGIIYAFWHGKLYSVTIWTQNEANYKALRRVTFEQFGEGSRGDKSLERYIWSDRVTDRMLEYMEKGQHGMLWMRSREMDRQLKLSKYNSAISYIKWMKERKIEKQKADIEKTTPEK